MKEKAPDLVIIATGGVPNVGYLQEGEELATTSWDILGGSVPIHNNVLFYDDNGQHAGVSCAEVLAEHGC